MMRKQNLLGSGLVAVAAATLLMSPTVASAADEAANLTDEQVASMEVALTGAGIDAATRESLISKIQAGQLLDAWTDAAPVATSTEAVDGFTETTSVYADGSVDITSAQIPEAVKPNGLALRGTACSVPDGPYPFGWNFTGCEISRATSGVAMTYYINGRTSGQSESQALISAIQPVSCSFAGGTVQSTNQYIITPQATTAVAEGTCAVDLFGGVGTQTFGLRANVSDRITAEDR